MEISDASLSLFFTSRVGLKTWDEIGSLDREVEIYRRLTRHLRSVEFVTYGGAEDRGYSGRLSGIGIMPVKWHTLNLSTIAHLLLKHYSRIRDTRVMKTNQIRGSEIPIWLKEKLDKKLIVRCGYLPSYFARMCKERDKSFRKLEGTAFNAADIGVVTTKWQREIVLQEYGVEPDKVRVIPNYVLTDVFKPDGGAEKKYDLVFVGRGGKQKNLDSLFRALKQMNRAGKKVSLLLVGSCCGDQAVVDTVSRLGLKVECAGNVPTVKLPGFLNQARAFILPSLYEGHPKSLLEAMSCGLPCIGSDVQGIREDIEHMMTGYLCGADSAGITEAVETVLADESLRGTLGDKAMEYVKRYSVDEVMRMELDVIREVLADDG